MWMSVEEGEFQGWKIGSGGGQRFQKDISIVEGSDKDSTRS